MSRMIFGFYDLDAGPQHGITGDLATRLGTATGTEGFLDGSVYVRSDLGAVAIAVRNGGPDDWEKHGAVAVLLQAADWRARESDVRAYRLAVSVAGGGDAITDATFFIIQRFVMRAERQEEFVRAVTAYTERYAAPIPGFVAGDAYVSLDGTRVVFVMPWSHEAALSTLENTDGSLEAMQTHLQIADHHSYASYQRVSFLRGNNPGGGVAQTQARRRGVR